MKNNIIIKFDTKMLSFADLLSRKDGVSINWPPTPGERKSPYMKMK